MLYDKVKKPQFRQWYVKRIFINKISPSKAARTDLLKLNAFLMTFPPNQKDLILNLRIHKLAESSKNLLTRIMV